MASPVEVRAYAKINLTLEVLGRRSDGYHEVRTVLQTIGLWDTLRFGRFSSLELECSSQELAGESNLVLRAAEALRSYAKCEKGAQVFLEKRVPVGMGLGGGSSDAAATILALDHLWGLDLGRGELESIARSVGSDVPFFISQCGTAVGEGRGDVIIALPPLSEQWLVLACPEVRVEPTGGKTAHVYSLLGEEHYTNGGNTQLFVDSLKDGEFSDEHLFNAFEPLAPSAFESFEKARRVFLGSSASNVHLTGTGPGMYTFVPSREDGETITESLKNLGLTAYCIKAVQPETGPTDE